MLNISKFLEKFKKNIETGELLNSRIIEIVKNKTGIVLNIGDFEIKEGVLYFKTSPMVRNKLFIYKDDLIRETNLLSGLKIVDIR
ncbi:MAG: hypothetical protein CEO12_264 [Parcubacteria group bacterium Gr01-1014_46]|nr:MAG: hypothetical protein CEO12_264 [Parcubacteria group bacterium Gr01-1014_46]